MPFLSTDGGGGARVLGRIMLLTGLVSLMVTAVIMHTVGPVNVEQVPMLVPVSATVLSPEENFTMPARPAAFGPSFPGPSDGDGGLTADVYVVKGLACVPEHLNDSDNIQEIQGKMALVMRGQCGFYDKVMNLQKLGAVGVLVGDNVYRRGLVTMYTSGEHDFVTIPSAFVSRESYDIISHLNVVTVTATPDTSPFINTVLFLLVSPLFSLSLVYAILVFHRRYKMMKDRAPKSLVEQLPTRVWYRDIPSPAIVRDASDDDDDSDTIPDYVNGPSSSRSGEITVSRAGQPGSAAAASTVEQSTSLQSAAPHPAPHRPEKVWVSAGECIICLEDYVSGVSEVMRLPCGHEFHVECVSKWLICRKKTCPICKRDVTKAAETTPLIKRRDSHR